MSDGVTGWEGVAATFKHRYETAEANEARWASRAMKAENRIRHFQQVADRRMVRLRRAGSQIRALKAYRSELLTELRALKAEHPGHSPKEG